MAAITALVVATGQQGQRIVASNRLYGRTTQLFSQELPRFGVTTEYVDANDPAQVDAALAKGARLLFVETMSNPLLRVPDLPRLAGLAHERQCLLFVDNTFATPVLTRPLELGADLVMESLTKIIGGHSDVTLGFAGGKGDLLSQVTQMMSIWGLASNPFDCWLAERGLATLALRLKAASANALALAEDRARVLREVESLPLPLRQVIMLYYYDDLTYREAAELLGVSAATVNARLTKARATLRERMSDRIVQ